MLDVIRKEAGFSTEKNPVSDYVESSKSLKDLKDSNDQFLSLVRALRILPFDTTLGRAEADVGSWCACEHGNHWYTFTRPT
jgi:hypothetical protein